MDRPVADVIRRRYSCRSYRDRPLGGEVRLRLEQLLSDSRLGPLGSAARFKLVTASPDDSRALRGLTTYGFVKGATGFMVGVVGPGHKNLEDFGYLMERTVLEATNLGLGTCWLGGTFSRSRFAARIGPARDEIMPAVVAVGYPTEGREDRLRLRELAGSSRRLPSGHLFWHGRTRAPLPDGDRDPYAGLLELVRWAPSASNKQPWRLIRTQEAWHFYLRRTKGYGRAALLFSLARLADLPRVDMGIAMCHFEMAAREAGLEGSWVVRDPELATPAEGLEYTVSWLRG